jgi:predicted PurR-regulated permease PerM
VFVWWVFRPIASVLFTLFVALLLAYVLDPLVDWFQARRVPRGVSILVLLLGASLGIVGLALWVIPPVWSEASGLADRLARWLETDSASWLVAMEERTGVPLAQLGAEARTKLQAHAPDALRWLGGVAASLASRTGAAASSLLTLVMIPLFTYYFLLDFDKMTAWAAKQIPPRYAQSVLSRAAHVHALLGEWLRGQVEVALALAVFYAAGNAIVGLEAGAPIGILSGLLSIVPYLGFAVGFGLALLMAVVSWQGPEIVAGVAVVYTLGQVLESYVLTPRLVGEKVGLPPVATLVAILVGGEAFGLLGIVLAVPVAGILKLLGTELLQAYHRSRIWREAPPADKGDPGG